MKSKYRMILDDIRKQIDDHVLKPGDMLPTENKYVEMYDVSRTTIQRALNILVSQGIIYRVQGRGTFVNAMSSEEISKEAVKETANEKGLSFAIVLPYRAQTTMGFLVGAQNYFESHNYTLIVRFTDCTYNSEISVVQSLVDSGMDGIIIYPCEYRDLKGYYRKLYTSSTHIVTIDKRIAGVSFSCASSDNYMGGYQVAEYLISLGHKDFAFFSDSFTAGHTLLERYQGFSDCLRKNGVKLKKENTLIISITTPGIEEKFRSFFLSHRKLVTAFFCTTDHLASLAYRAAYEADCRIPDEISVVGYDNHELSKLISPPLTTVEQPYYEIGEAAADLLLKTFNEKKHPIAHLQLPVKIIKRNSVRDLNP